MREPENGAVLRASLEVFFSKGSGNFPEFFEKSIDKQKIDAILNSAVRFLRRILYGTVRGRRYPGAMHPGAIPIQGTDIFTAGNGVYFMCMHGNGTGDISLRSGDL